MKTIEVKQSRFELRLSEADKVLFEKASAISGYKTLTSFVTSVLRNQAKEIIFEHEQILKTEKDKEIFFDALLSNNQPNKKLQEAYKKYSTAKTDK